MKKTAEEKDKLKESVAEFEHALNFIEQAKSDQFYFSGISKSFEVCFEYAWKYMKRRAIEEGLEVASPKDAIRHAGRLGLVDDVEKWFDFLKDRNLAVHDYLGISDEDYLKTIRDFSAEVKRLIGK